MIGYIHTKGGIDTSDATATANNILQSKTAYVNDQKITGTMPNNGTLNYNASINQQFIPEGYTSGGIINATTSAIDSNIKAEYIKKGISILGVNGTFTEDSNATANNILIDKTAYVNGQKITGTMANRGNLAITPTTSQQTFPSGYYSGISCEAKEEIHAISLNFSLMAWNNGIGGSQTLIGAYLENVYMQLTTILPIDDWFILNSTNVSYSSPTYNYYIVFRYLNNGWDIGIKQHNKDSGTDTVEWLATNVQKGQTYNIQSTTNEYISATFTVEDIFN